MKAEVMVDTSVWIEYFRRDEGRACDTLDALLEQDRALLCGVVEILRGLRPGERERVSDLFLAVPYLETERRDFVSAGERLGNLRRRGITIPLTEVLVGALYSRHGVALLTLDRHFDQLSDVRHVLGEESGA